MKLKSLISEGRTKLGKIEFSTNFKNDRIILMARSSKDLDLLDDVKNSSNKDIRELLLPLLEKKSGLKFRIDYSYSGAGYSFKIEEDSILKLLENEMKLGNIVKDILNEGPAENKKVKALLDKHLKDLRKGGPNHLWAVMHILMGALSDANFHSESKKVAALFGSKAKYEGDPMGEKDLEEMYHYDLGPNVANICKWDGKEIVNALGFYISMTIGRPLGQKVEALVESKGMKLFKESVYLKEAASRTAVEIYGLTGLNPDAIQKFVDKFKLDIEKAYQFVKNGKLKDRTDFVVAVTGNPNNPFQRKLISMFESVNEADVKKKINRRGDVDGLIVTHNGNNYEIVYSGDFTMSSAIQPYGIVMPGDDVVSFLGKDKKAKFVWKQIKPKVDKFLKSNESVNEAVSKEAMGIAAFTGTRGIAVQNFIDDYNLDARKLFNFVKNAKLKDRTTVTTAIAGKSGNKYQGDIVAMFGESVNEAQTVNPKSKKFLNGMKKIKVNGLGGYMPGVDYIYVDGDEYYFVDFEGDHMELKNTDTIKQLHKLHGKSLGEGVVNEANYKVYHKSFTEASEEARAMAEKRGFEINEDDWQSQIVFGGKNLRSRPSEGKTTAFTVGLSKDGKPQRKALQIQVYGMKNGYELNAYIN